jgi:phosphatidylglycerol---prolipoprotein diacylglyceryl transferase
MLAEFVNFSGLGVDNLVAISQFFNLDLSSACQFSLNGHSCGQSLLAFQFTSPGEEIFRLGSFRLKWYGVLIATAVLIGVNLSMRLAKSRNLDPEAIADLAIWLVLAAIPSARLYYVAFEWPTYSQHPEQIIKIWEGGIAIHGAIIGGSIAAIIFAKFKQLSFWQLADVVAPSVALGQTIGRWGNFFNSEAFGRPTDLPWKLYIPKDRRPVEYLNFDYFHPTFLYESVWNLLVFIILMWLFIRDSRYHRLRTGSIFLVYVIAYSVGRFGVEGLRTDSLMFGSLRMAQVISLVGITIGSIGLLWLYIRRRSLPDVV